MIRFFFMILIIFVPFPFLYYDRYLFYKIFTGITRKILQKAVVRQQQAIPSASGAQKARAAQRQPPASFLIDSRVVAQGQCAREKIITFSAVSAVQPFATKRSWKACRSVASASVPRLR